jgi:polyhydroxyalkanoate synthesis regulator phasin
MPILDDNNHEEVSHVYEDNDVITNNNITTLTEKVWNLETSVNEIKGLVKQMFNLMPNNPNNPNLAIY